MCAEATVTNRDWKEIERDLNGPGCSLPQGAEEVLLTHFADALAREEETVLSTIRLELAVRASSFPEDRVALPKAT